MANSMLAGSKFSEAYARKTPYGILEEVHRSGLTSTITFVCDRLSLVISPKSTTCSSDVETEAFSERAAGARDPCWCLEEDPRHGRRRKTCCRRGGKTPVQGRVARDSLLCVVTPKKSFQSPQHQHLAGLQLWSGGNG